MKTVNTLKLVNALKYQRKVLTMNDVFNSKLGTDFFHWSIVRQVRLLCKKDISYSDVVQWLETI
jgi:hypothetical protein